MCESVSSTEQRTISTRTIWQSSQRTLGLKLENPRCVKFLANFSTLLSRYSPPSSYSFSIAQKNKLKRLRRRRSVSADSENERDLVNIFNDDEGEGDGDAGGVENLFDADEMAGFIEDDTDDDSQRGSDEDSDDGARRRKRKEKQKKKESRKQGGRKGFGMGSVEGITAEAWQEVAEVFGTGQDYAWAMEEDEQTGGKEKDLKDVSLGSRSEGPPGRGAEH